MTGGAAMEEGVPGEASRRASVEPRSAGERGTLGSLLERQEERLSHCVHCGFCLPACPTYVRLGDENDSPRGRLHLMRAVAEGRLDPGGEAFGIHIDRCLGCRACETVCPSGVEYGLLLEQARAERVSVHPPGFLTRVLLAVFPSRVLRGISMGLARLLRATGLAGPVARALPGTGVTRIPRFGLAMLGATRPAGLPDIPSSADGGGSSAPVPPGSRGRAALLTGCVQEGLYHRVNQATRRVLEVNGWEVVPVPGQTCCGALHSHAGELDRARTLAKANVKAFAPGESGTDVVVMNAAGCGAAMKDYPHLLEDEEDWVGPAKEFASRVMDLAQVLELHPVVQGAPLSLRVTADDPCHLRHAQGVQAPSAVYLSAVPGIEFLVLPRADECCGGAGIYGITHPDLGGRIGSDKVAAVLGTEAQVVVTGNPGCMMQIGAGLLLENSDIRVMHPVEVLDESYRRAGLYR